MSKSIFGIGNSSLIPTRLRTDAPLMEERRRVRLRLRDGHPGTVAVRYPCYRSQADDQGFVEHVVYVSEMAALQAKVETDEAGVVAARATYYRKLRELCAQAAPDRRVQVLGVPGDPRQPGLPDNISLWPEWAQKLEARCPLSVEAEFHSTHGRGIRPFVEFKVVEKVDAPQTEEQATATQHRADMLELAEVLAAAMPKPQPVSEIAAAVVAALVSAGVISVKK